MSISIKEYCGVNNVVTSRDTTKEIPMKESTAVSDYIAPTADTLMVEIEGIHAYPYHTRNYTRYMPEALKESQFKWTHPYLKPLIKHHNDQNGEIIGRIYDATYSEKTSIDNVGGLYFTVSVPDKKAEYEVENRLLETVSIGVSTNDVRCSICGSPIIDAEEGCPNNHVRGAKYDGETCYWDIYNIEPKELSYVIVPSDAYAKNVTFYRAKDKNSKSTALHESLDNKLTNNNKTDNNIGGSSPNMDLEKQLAEVQEENSKLKAELEAAKASLAELEEVKAAKAELEKTLDEVKKEVLFGALSCEQWRQRFEMLVHRGWKKSSQNKKEEIPLAAEYISRIETKRYSSDRKGHLEQINDRARVRFLVSYEQAKKVNVKG